MADVGNSLKINVEQKKLPRGENSFVAPYAYFEFQFNLFLSVKMTLTIKKNSG